MHQRRRLQRVAGSLATKKRGCTAPQFVVYDRHQEEQNVGVFTRALRSSIEEFLDDPLGAPLVPNWARVWAGVPDAGVRLMSAVQEGQGDLHALAVRNGG